MSHILPALFLQHPVQLLYVFRVGNRSTNIAADITYEFVYQPLFIAGYWIAEYSFKAVMSGEYSIAYLFPGMGTETILGGNFAVIKDNPLGNGFEILEYLN